MTSNFIEINDLTFAYPRTRKNIFENLNIALGRDVHTVALLGKDGSGKSTLLKLLFNLVSPQRGEVLINGTIAYRHSDMFLKQVSYMPQEAFLYQELTVIENLVLSYELKTQGEADLEHLYGLLDHVGLLKFKDFKVNQLSGGMKQKIGLLCTIVHEPKILILDEPTVGVDPISRHDLWEIINDFLDEESYCIFSTAYLEEAQEADACIIISDDGVLSFEVGPLIRQYSDICYSIEADDYLEAYFALLHLDFEKYFVDLSVREGKINFILNQGISAGQARSFVSRALNGKRFRMSRRTTTLEDVYLKLLKKEPYNISVEHHSQDSDDEQTVISLTNVKKAFGNFVAVDNTTFDVKKKEIFGLLGPNGAGKTTTFRMMCALLDQTGGRILVNGQNLKKAKSQVRAQIGYVSQKFSLYTKLTCYQNIEYFAKSYGINNAELGRRLDELMAIFEIKEYLDVMAKDIPFGTQRELSMVSALLHRPQILFLDEATSGADIVARRKLWLILNLLKEQGVTVIITTHFLEEAEFCDRFLIQSRGEIICIGRPDEICLDSRNRRISVHQLFIDKVKEQERQYGKDSRIT